MADRVGQRASQLLPGRFREGATVGDRGEPGLDGVPQPVQVGRSAAAVRDGGGPLMDRRFEQPDVPRPRDAPAGVAEVVEVGRAAGVVDGVGEVQGEVPADDQQRTRPGLLQCFHQTVLYQ